MLERLAQCCDTQFRKSQLVGSRNVSGTHSSPTGGNVVLCCSSANNLVAQFLQMGEFKHDRTLRPHNL